MWMAGERQLERRAEELKRQASELTLWQVEKVGRKTREELLCAQVVTRDGLPESADGVARQGWPQAKGRE